MRNETKYQGVREVSKPSACILASCPAVYFAVRDLSSKPNECGIGACPEVQERGNVYLIIGKQINPVDARLEKKVGEGEVLIEVPRGLIDGMKR